MKSVGFLHRRGAIVGALLIAVSGAALLRGQREPVEGRAGVDGRVRTLRAERRLSPALASKATTTVGREFATIEVAGEGSNPDAVNAVRITGGQWERVRPAMVDGAVSLRVAVDEMQYLRTTPAAGDARVLSAARPTYALGVLARGVRRADGTIGARTWQLVIAAESPPAVWDPEAGGYAMGLFVGLAPSEDPADAGAHGPAEVRLPRPITVRFQGRNARLAPRDVRIETTGVAGYQDVSFLASRRDLESTITAISDFGDTPPLEVEIAARCADLALEAPNPSLLGLGLGTIEIGVVRVAEDTMPLLTDEPLEVSLTGEGGIVPATVTIPAGSQRGAGTLRSSGLGEVRVRASGAGVTSSRPLVLSFRFPWAIGAASVLFGGCGGVLRTVTERRRRRGRSRRRPPAWWAYAVEGAFVGLVAVVVALVGVRFSVLPAAVVATEAGAAVIAVFAGFGGAGFFLSLRRLVLREKEEPDSAKTAAGGPD